MYYFPGILLACYQEAHVLTEKLDSRIMIRIGAKLLANLEREADRQGRKPSALARKLIADGIHAAKVAELLARDPDPMAQYKDFGPLS